MLVYHNKLDAKMCRKSMALNFGELDPIISTYFDYSLLSKAQTTIGGTI